MGFNEIISAVETQLKADTTILSYVDVSQIHVGFKDIPMPTRYSIIIEPTDEAEEAETADYLNAVYTIEIYARIGHGGLTADSIKTGTNFGKGVLDFVKDIKAALRANGDFGLNSSGISVTGAAISTQYTLGPNIKHLTISINGFRPIGYDEIGVTGALSSNTLVEGSVIATTLQSNIRALDDGANGFGQVTVTYDNDAKQFTITSAGLTGPESSVEVSEGATDSAYAALRFDTGTETRGVQIVGISFGDVTDTGYEYYPVRYRIIPLQVTEELYVPES